MKTIFAALGYASLLAAAAPAVADPGHRGGWSHSGPAPSAFGVNSHGSFQHASFPPGAVGFSGRHFHPGFRGYPVVFPAFGLGFAFGLSAFDPWYWGGPYYGYGYGPYYGAYAYGPPPPYDYPPPQNAQAAPAPPAASTAEQQAPAACGSWSWDSAKQAYNWVPC